MPSKAHVPSGFGRLAAYKPLTCTPAILPSSPRSSPFTRRRSSTAWAAFRMKQASNIGPLPNAASIAGVDCFGNWRKRPESPGFHQRFFGTLSDDGKTITARWEGSPDGTNWTLDFPLTYTRLG